MGEASCIPHGEIGEKQVSPAAANESTEQSRRIEPQIQSLNEGQSDDSISNTAAPIIINSLYLGTESDGLGQGGRAT